MAISKTVDGSNTTIQLSYTANTTKIENTLTLFAQYHHENGIIPGALDGIDFDNLTVAQIGQIVDYAIVQHVKTVADAQHVRNEKLAAEATARANLDTTVGLS